MSNTDSDPYLLKPPASTPVTHTAHANIATSPFDSSLGQILQNLQSNNTNDDPATPKPKRSRNIVLTPELFDHLLRAHSGTITSSPTNTAHTHSAQPAYYNNAKYEEISSKGIKPLYDGSEETLIPFLTKLDIRRQHEGWAPATYITLDNKQTQLHTLRYYLRQM